MDSNNALKENVGETFEQVRIREQTHARLRLHNLCNFMEEHNGKWISGWECNFLASLRDNLKLTTDVITERQQETLETIYKRLEQGKHL